MILCTAATQQEPRAKASWWERTGSSVTTSRTHRVRSDLGTPETLQLAQEVDALSATITRALGNLRPREAAPQELFLFSTKEDLDDTMRSQIAVDPIGPVFAFRSPITHGIAFTNEDTPGPLRARSLGAALACESLRLTCSGDIPVAIQQGIADLVARGWCGGGLGSGGIGDAGAKRVRDAAAENKLMPLREMVALDRREWGTRIQSDPTGALGEEAASFVRFLVGSKGSPRERMFLSYLAAVSSGATGADAFAFVYGVRTDDEWRKLETQWRQFVMKEPTSTDETVRERLAFLGEGIRALDADGGVPATFADLSRDLRDRSFISPGGWRPGFSVVDASWSGVFTPALPAEPAKEQTSRPRPKDAKPAEFTLVSSARTSPTDRVPPSIEAIGVRPRLKLAWEKTRQEPEAPWVWMIGPVN